MKQSDIIDRLAIEDIASLIDRAVDEKRWDDVACHFAASVIVDIGAISGGKASEFPRSDFVQGIAAVNPPDKRTFHSRYNVLTQVDGDRATMSTHSYG